MLTYGNANFLCILCDGAFALELAVLGNWGKSIIVSCFNALNKERKVCRFFVRKGNGGKRERQRRRTFLRPRLLCRNHLRRMLQYRLKSSHGTLLNLLLSLELLSCCQLRLHCF